MLFDVFLFPKLVEGQFFTCNNKSLAFLEGDVWENGWTFGGEVYVFVVSLIFSRSFLDGCYENAMKLE